MGYDFYCVQDDEGELEQVRQLTGQFQAAATERDALGDDARGAWEDGEWRAHIEAGGDPDTLPPNATQAYRDAQAKVSMLYEAMHLADRRYFRLNVWGMERYRRAMWAFDVVRSDYATPPWPELDQTRTCWLRNQKDGTVEVIKPDHWYSEWASEPEWRDTDYVEPEGDALAQFEKHKAEREAYLAWRPDPQEDFRIPLHKFASNDGWLVTPEEAFFAGNTLKTIRDAEDERFGAVLGANGFESDDNRRYFDRWIDYLLLASERGGFRVH